MYLVAGAAGLFLIFRSKTSDAVTFSGSLSESPRGEENDTVTEALTGPEAYYGKLYSRRSSRVL